MVLLVLVAIGVGLLLPLQVGVNAQLRNALGDPIGAALLSFLVGTAALLLLLLAVRAPLPIVDAWSRTPWTYWSGGILGAAYVAMAIVLAPRLGAGTLTAAVVAGQMLTSVVLDHYGWVGFPQHSISIERVLGAALVIAGVVLIQR